MALHFTFRTKPSAGAGLRWATLENQWGIDKLGLGDPFRSVGDADLSNAAWAMRPKTALYLATLRGTAGAPCYPGATAKGGTLLGLPVLTSNAITDANSPSEAYIALLCPGEIQVADDGQSLIEYSEQASIEMVDAPTAGAATMVSPWQHGLVGLRASRAINWRRQRAVGSGSCPSGKAA